MNHRHAARHRCQLLHLASSVIMRPARSLAVLRRTTLASTSPARHQLPVSAAVCVRCLWLQLPTAHQQHRRYQSTQTHPTRSPTPSTSTTKPIYIATPIFYLNGVPHLGHLYTAVLADTLARSFRVLQQRDVFLLTGTDEHGIKVQESAEKHSNGDSSYAATLQYCDGMADKFKQMMQRMDIQYDRFIRTTEEQHKHAVHHLWHDLLAAQQLYVGAHSGWYSKTDEAFITNSNNNVVQGEDGQHRTVDTNTPVFWYSESNYKFKLASWQDAILQYVMGKQSLPLTTAQHSSTVTHSTVFPDARRQEIVSWLQSNALDDISVSRPSDRVRWGISVPNDPQHTIYVWLDALTNYLTATSYPSNNGLWPIDYHIIGKDIIRFHSVYWIGFLLSAGIALPKFVAVHGHWTVDNRKMSKSIGNVIDPFTVVDTYGKDAVRFFLLAQGSIENDNNYSTTDMHKHLNVLADVYGNLVMRCTATKILADGKIPPFDSSYAATDGDSQQLLDQLQQLTPRVLHQYATLHFSHAIEDIFQVLRNANVYFSTKQPWQSKKQADQQAYNTVIALCLEIVRVTTILLQPVLPDATARVLSHLQVPERERSAEYATLRAAERGGVAIQPFSQPLFHKVSVTAEVSASSLTTSATSSTPASASGTANKVQSPRKTTQQLAEKLLSDKKQQLRGFHSSPYRFHAGHGHSHGRGGSLGREARTEEMKASTSRVTVIGIFADCGLAIFKLIAGIYGNSVAMIADAAHSVSDLVIDFVTLFSSRLSHQPKDLRHPFGHGKFESIGTLLVSAGLVGTAAFIGLEAVESIQHVLSGAHVEVPTNLALFAAIVAIITKESLFRVTRKVAEKYNSKVIRANAYHHRSDAVSSLVALVAVVGAQTSLPLLDGIGGIIVSGMILKAGVETASDALRDLVDANLDQQQLNEINRFLSDFIKRRKEIVSISDVKGRTAGPYMLLDIDITVKSNLTVTATQQVIESLRAEVMHSYPSVAEVNVHVFVEGQSTKKELLADLRPQSEVEADVYALIKRTHPHDIQGISHMLCHYVDAGITVELGVVMRSEMTIAEAQSIAHDLQQAIVSEVAQVTRTDIHCELSLDDIERNNAKKHSEQQTDHALEQQHISEEPTAHTERPKQSQ